MTILNYPGVPGTTLYGGRPKESPQGTAGVATAVTLESQTGTPLATSHTTFGFSFPKGAMNLTQHDLHASVSGAEIPIQMDAIATHDDGSVRYAVLSVAPGAFAANEQKTIDLTTGNKFSAYSGTLPSVVLDPEVVLTVYGMQRTRIALTGSFALGATVSVTITRNSVASTYSVVAASEHMQGGAIDRGLLGVSLAAAITAGGKFRARCEGWGPSQGYMEVEVMDGNDAAFTVTHSYTGSGVVTITETSAYVASNTTLTANAQSLLSSQIAASNAGTISFKERRLHGPVVSEFRQVVRFRDTENVTHTSLLAAFDIRIYADGRRMVDISIENTGVTDPSPKQIHYSAQFKLNGSVVATQPRFWHMPKARWRKTLWSGPDAQIHVTRDMEYHMSSRNMPRLDLAYGDSSAQLDSRVANEASLATSGPLAYLGPMAPTLLNAAMGTTGGRPEIGLISDFVYNYYATQDTRALHILKRVVDNAGCFACYYRDELTDYPVSLDSRPGLSTLSATATIGIPTGMQPYSSDGSHQGTYGYHLYLLTGDHYYLDDMLFWHSRNSIQSNWSYRFDSNYCNILDEQTRGTAWLLRTLYELCVILPAMHPRKQYHLDTLSANITHMISRLGLTFAYGPFNCQPLGDMVRADNWQADFIMAVFGWLMENDVVGADVILAHMGVYQFGRVLESAQGVCPKEAVQYFPPIVKAGTSELVTTWAEYGAAVEAASADPGISCSERPLANWDYAAVLLAAMRVCAGAGDPLAVPAKQVWEPIAAHTLAQQGYRKWAMLGRA